MGTELDNNWYNEVFKTGGSEYMYFLKYDKTPWYPVWKIIAARIKELGAINILDIGCGPGQFADCLLSEITNADASSNILPQLNYIGIDFSSVAIDFANKLNLPASFIVADATSYDYSQVDYDLVVTTEFLEHITDDLGVLSKIKKGSVILATLPNQDSEGHVRFLSKNTNTAKSQIKQRYSGLCKIVSIKKFSYVNNRDNADFLIEMIRL
jgi:SAM-dependent methyltransferase